MPLALYPWQHIEGKLMALILVVDDRTNMLTSVGAVLEGEHNCILASDGAQALEYYERNRPSLVLLDLVMPGLSGQEVARLILERDPDASIVIFSVVENVREIVNLFRIGVSDYLVKPCDGNRLLETVNGNLRDREGPELVETPTSRKLRATLSGILQSGEIPVLFGSCGTGKRTELKASMKELGVESAIVAGPLPIENTQDWIGSGFRMNTSGRAGLVLWSNREELNADGLQGIREWYRIARRTAPNSNGIRLGVTWDQPASGSGPVPSDLGSFVPVRMPTLVERREELGTILEQFQRIRGGRDQEAISEDTGWFADLLHRHPRLGTMRLMRALATEPELWRHLRGRERL